MAIGGWTRSSAEIDDTQVERSCDRRHRRLRGIRSTTRGALPIFISLIAGCALPLKRVPLDATPTTTREGPVKGRHRSDRAESVAGRSVEGRAIDVRILGRGPDVALILATIHGDEGRGTALVRGLERHLVERPELLNGRRVVLVPVANPDGLALGTRFNAHGVDLNRNFPAANFARSREHGASALSEPESRALEGLIRRHRPSRIVSLHEPLACIDWDGPAEPLARAMGASGSLRVRKLGGRPGSLGSWAGETLGIPIITLELPRSASSLDERALWSQYGPTLLAAVTFAGSRPTAASP